MADDDQKDDKAPDTADLFAQHAEKTNKILEELTSLAKAQAVAPAAPVQKAEPAKKVERYTVAQLQAAVEAGKIDQATALEAIRLQERQDLEAEMERKIAERLQASTAVSKVQQRIDEYASRMPALRHKGSEEWTKASEAYRQLLEDGHQEGLRTELAALRIAFPEGAAPKHETRETTTERTRKAEVTVTSGSRKQGTTRKGDPLSGLSDEERAYVEARIQNGRFKDANDPAIAKLVESHRERLEGKRVRFGGR